MQNGKNETIGYFFADAGGVPKVRKMSYFTRSMDTALQFRYADYVKQLHGCLRDERCDPAAKTWLPSKGSNSRSVWNDERQIGQENPDSSTRVTWVTGRPEVGRALELSKLSLSSLSPVTEFRRVSPKTMERFNWWYGVHRG